MSDRLVRDYDMELTSPECHPGSEKTRLFVRLKQDISEALPYLNGALKGKDYNHEAKILLWNDAGRTYAFRPYEIALSPVKEGEDARKSAEAIVEKVNDIWSRRSEVEPDFKGRKPLPNALEIYKLLPKTNCRECGSPTCMAFAASLRSDFSRRSSCRHLSEDDFAKLAR